MTFSGRLYCVFIAALLAGCATSSSAKKPMTSSEKVDLLLQTAHETLRGGDVIGALQYLAEAETLDNKRAELYQIRALAFLQKNENAEALKAARRAVELRPQVSEYLNNLGKILVDQRKYSEAEKPLVTAASDQLYREAFKANTNLGILYYRQGEEEKARVRFTKATEQSPDDACVAYYYLGHISLRSGKFSEAIRNYDHATRKFCASFSDAHFALGLAYERSKQYDKARRKFMDITTTFPDTSVAVRAVDHIKNLP